MSFPKPPEKIVPFNSGPVAAHDIGRQFDEHRRGIAGIINFLKTIIRDDGVMRETSMPAPAANAALRRGGSITPAAVQPALPTGVLGPDAGGFFATDEQSAGPLAQDYAQVSIDWAEHMPDTIPNQTMAVMAITGQHWSSRWWANQAALSAGQIVGNYLPLAGGTMTGPLVIPVVANLNVGGGGTGQVLTAKDGSGALSWSTPSGTFIDAPSNSQYYSRYNGAWVVSPGGLIDAPNDGSAYARKNQAWAHLTHADITDWSTVLAGYATVGAVPVASTVAPTMDGAAAVGVGTTWARADHVHPSDLSRLALSGGTMTGPLMLAADPAAPLQPSTKQYVDAHVSYGENRIINGNFAVNQRAYVSGAAIAAAAYGHDRWKAGAGGCTYTFTAALPDTAITITAGTLTQIIEAGMIEGGVYTLSWAGTAQARVYQGAPAGSYAASPLAVTALPAGVNTVVEFNAGTMTRVKLETGVVATLYNRQSLARSLVDCQRYYYDPAGGGSSPVYFSRGYSPGAGSIVISSMTFPVAMRSTPTMFLRNPSYTNATGITASPSSPQTFTTALTVTAAGTSSAQFNLTANAEL